MDHQHALLTSGLIGRLDVDMARIMARWLKQAFPDGALHDGADWTPVSFDYGYIMTYWIALAMAEHADWLNQL